MTFINWEHKYTMNRKYTMNATYTLGSEKPPGHVL